MSAISRRCAIYTRKSTEEGLEQDFNSLQAQREACEAYVKSQKGEGWEALSAPYDDGGFSGGNMERPALKRLLADIKAKLVDVIVVYKVDRLTRSLADFAKIVEVFDAHGVSFVAVTQQFNTTSSMGRLTLNVLLSFAQFEREVIGERVRDKIAASKRKGMWMGGNVPLGYDAVGRSLAVNPDEAELVRYIFQRYLALGSVRKLKEQLDREGRVTKIRVSQAGNRWGGVPFDKGALHQMLQNPVYIGAIRHKRAVHPGQHEPIIEQALWDDVQARIAAHRGKPRGITSNRQITPLGGKLFDARGQLLTPVYTTNHGRKYRYYVSPQLTRRTADESTTWRLPANGIERAVADAVIGILSDGGAMADALARAGMLLSRLPAVMDEAAVVKAHLASRAHMGSALAEIVTRVEVSDDALMVTLSLARLVGGAGNEGDTKAPAIMRRIPMMLTRRGIETRIVIEGARAAPTKADPALLKAVARGWAWFEELSTGQAESMGAIAEREGVTDRYVGRMIRLGFLSPEIVEGIVSGKGASELTVEQLTEEARIPMAWSEQPVAMGVEIT